MKSELEKDIEEYTIQYKSEGDSILMPIGNFRQQTLFRKNLINIDVVYAGTKRVLPNDTKKID